MASKSKRNEKEVIGFLGVGMDQKDEHKRVSRNQDFLLIGGSEETHERLQDISIHFYEALEERGKVLKETSPEEAVDLLRKAADR